MKQQLYNIKGKPFRFRQWQCHVVYILLLIPFVYGIILLENKSRVIFHLLLFFTGWLTFTFLEYIAHRFWMHNKKRHRRKEIDLHTHHHSHPWELKITSRLRNRLVIGNLLLFAIAFALDNYFTAVAGLCTGFVLYSFIHVLLHKPYAKKIIPYLLASHIHHHCKYPDMCFGISITWWDRVFKTFAGGETITSDKVLSFYFNKKTG